MAKNGIIVAAIWSSIQRFGGLAISFISNMILARLLSPDDFGTMGLIMVFITVADVLVDGGLGNALIQKKEIEEKDKTTIFTTNLVFSLFLFVFLFIIAPFVESFTGVPNFSLLLRVQSVCVLVRAFYVVNVSQITRLLNYKSLARITLISQSFATIIAIVMAYRGMGVWSLLFKTILLDLFNCLFYALASPFKYKLGFCKESFKELFSFGFPVAIANIVESFYANIVSFIVGKAYSVRDLGYFNQANSLKQIPVYSVSAVINQVSFPYLSRIQDDNNALRGQFRTTVRVVSFFVYPILSFLIFFAEPVITILYSQKWLACVPIFQVLCLSGFLNALYHLSRSTIKAIGKSRLLLHTQLLSVLLSLMFVFLFLYLNKSIVTFVWVIVIDAVLSYCIVGYCVGKALQYSLLSQIKDIFITFIIAMIVSFVSMKITALFVLPILPKLALSFTAVLILCFVLNYLLRNEIAIMIVSAVKNRFLKNDSDV